MAYRDQSQGFGFVYVDLAKLLAARESAVKNEEQQIEFDPTATTINLNRDPVTQPVASVEKLKENLDRLQTLHHKLHAMLDELNTLAENEKKRRKPKP